MVAQRCTLFPGVPSWFPDGRRTTAQEFEARRSCAPLGVGRRGGSALRCARPIAWAASRAWEEGRRRSQALGLVAVCSGWRADRRRRAKLRAADELADPRHLLRVLQLRRCLPVSADRRRFGWPLDARCVPGRPVVGRSRTVSRVESTCPASRSRWPRATATMSRDRRGPTSCISTPVPRASSEPRSRTSSPAVSGAMPCGTSRGRGRRASCLPYGPRRSRSTTRRVGSGYGSATTSPSGSAIATTAVRRSRASSPATSGRARSSSRTTSASRTGGWRSSTTGVCGYGSTFDYAG